MPQAFTTARMSVQDQPIHHFSDSTFVRPLPDPPTHQFLASRVAMTRSLPGMAIPNV